MKTIRNTILALAALAAVGCSESEENFDNRVYLESSERMTKLYVSIEDSYTINLVSAIPMQSDQDINVKYDVDRDLVDVYNETYGAQAVILPSEYYVFSSKDDVIAAGDVRSSSSTLEFSDVLSLDKDVLYVLPVRITEADIPILTSRSVNYYVFEGARLINIVAYMWENYCSVDWQNPSALTDMSQVTVEMLMKCNWDNRDDTNVSFFGVEGYFLFRCGDLSNPRNQLQFCSNGGGDLPAGPYLPYDEWFHLAATYDCSTRRMNIYVNGEYQSTSSGTTGSYSGGVTLARDDFHINTAYNNSRYADCYLSEVRIWNRVLSAEEIADETHPYYVDPESDGLVAYWKFNEGSGNVVSDRTGNGNDAVASVPITWEEVSMPD